MKDNKGAIAPFYGPMEVRFRAALDTFCEEAAKGQRPSVTRDTLAWYVADQESKVASLLAASKALLHYLEPMRLVCGTPEYVSLQVAVADSEGR